MSAGEWIALAGVLGGFLATVWLICSWSIDKYEKVQIALRASEAKSISAILATISKNQEKTEERIARWEEIQTNQLTTSMQKFQVMEIAIKDYSKDLYMVSEQIKSQRTEIEKLWTTMVKEIGEGWQRVSSPKKY